ncbi:MAG: MlaD family protein, partial [Planctomycetota bacterium]
SRVGPLWREHQEILVVFDNAGALRLDAPVRYNGVEVGRVKGMRILHLDDETIACLPELNKRQLDDLPLRPEALKRELRGVSDEDFPARCRAALQGRTMIQLCLDVLQEGDVKRYRLDDQVRIVTAVLGDTAVELISGSGSVNVPGSKGMLLGTSGDFFSNLAKSMGEVKEILSSVTDVVGAPERKSFVRAQARLSPIATRLDHLASTASGRTEGTFKRLDSLKERVKLTLDEASVFPDKVRPQAENTATRLKDSLSVIQDRLGGAQTEFQAASNEFTTGFKPIREDVAGVVKKSGPEFDDMRERLRQLYDVPGNLALKIEGSRTTAGWLYAQSQPDWERTLEAGKNSLFNLSCANQAALENKDLMLSGRDAGEYEYNTALDIYRRLTFATRRFRESAAELQDAGTLLAVRLPGQASMTVVQAAATVGRLAATRAPLDGVQAEVETLMLPPYVRKKEAWLEEVRVK